MKYQPDQKWRGFDLEFLLAHGCRLINDWFAPSIRDTNYQPSTPTSRMIIPSGESSYLARLTDQVKNYDIKARPFIHEKVHAGHKTLFNPDALQNEIVFVVEGYIDAMSLKLASFNCIALGGCAEGYLLLDALNKMDKYPQIIILFDSDDAGTKAAKSLHEELLQIKCPSVVRFLSKPTGDIANYDLACASDSAVMSSDNKIDANNILQKFGVEVLRGILQDILDNSLSELNAIEAELGKKDTAGLTDEDWEFIFSGNPSDLAFANRLERFCNNRVKWLTDSEHWLIFNGQIWQYGSEKNSCVSPLARKLAEAMTQNAESKVERHLAEKFQSAKKIGSAITLLKSCNSILITADDLNCHNELFCVRNGVVNLQIGELYPLAPKYLITQQSPAIYRPGYHNPIVDNFLTSILPDEETRAALALFIGYSATGEVIEERALFLYGGGAFASCYNYRRGEPMANKQITKQWYDATIQNNFVFGKTMELYPDLYRRLLELILNTTIKEITYLEREKTIKSRTDSKGIRLDVYVEEKGSNRSFDVEMQIANSDNIDKRMRYYQGLIDMDKLKREQHYSKLGKSVIIFICSFDRFEYGLHFYSFSERCDQNPNIKLNHGATKIFLSTKGTVDDVSPDILAFLNYVDSSIVSGKFVEELDAAVDSVKSNEKARHDFMTLQMALLEERMEGELQGEQRGRAKERESVAINMIRDGMSLEKIQKFTKLSFERIRELANNLKNQDI